MADSINIEIRNGNVRKRKNKENRIKITERERIVFFALPFSFTTYTVTNKKLTIKSGFLNTAEDDVPLYRITNVRLTTSFPQMIFGIGTLEVRAMDPNMPKFKILNIKNVRVFKEILERCIRIDRRREGVRATELLQTSILDFMLAKPELAGPDDTVQDFVSELKNSPNAYVYHSEKWKETLTDMMEENDTTIKNICKMFEIVLLTGKVPEKNISDAYTYLSECLQLLKFLIAWKKEIAELLSPEKVISKDYDELIIKIEIAISDFKDCKEINNKTLIPEELQLLYQKIENLGKSLSDIKNNDLPADFIINGIKKDLDNFIKKSSAIKNSDLIKQ